MKKLQLVAYVLAFISFSQISFSAVSLNTEWLVFKETHPIMWFKKLYVLVIVPAAMIGLLYVWRSLHRVWLQIIAGFLWICLFSQIFIWFRDWNIVQFRSWSWNASFAYWFVVLLLMHAFTGWIDRQLTEGQKNT